MGLCLGAAILYSDAAFARIGPGSLRDDGFSSLPGFGALGGPAFL